MKKIDLNKIRKTHFIGIGGIGVSAIARMMLAKGKEVTGSDREFSVITNDLKKLGAKIFLGHSEKNIADDIDLIIYTPALARDNPELQEAKKMGIPAISYPEALGLVSKDKYIIAVSGAHGKTTTTAMISKILTDAKLDPTVIVGSILNDNKSNFVAGKSKYLVCEACEYKESFLNLNPKIIVITNIDNDHLDYYKNLNNIKKVFAKFAGKLSKNDFLVCNKNDKNLKEIVEKSLSRRGGEKCKIIDYSKIKTDGLKLKVPGKHNIENAKAALAVAKILRVDKNTATESLNNFSGTWRRFEYKGKTKNSVLVYDDYAHHPTEIKATLKGAREFFGDKKIWCVFQPHLYSRTKLLLSDFGRSFNDADEIILTDIYAARESKDESINSKILKKEITRNGGKAIYLNSFNKAVKFLAEKTGEKDVIITMGAGDVYKISNNLAISKN